MKKCYGCQTEKSIEAFPFVVSGRRRNHCNSCFNANRRKKYSSSTKEREQARVRRSKNRPLQRGRLSKVIFEYKENNPCLDCGKYYIHSVMDFDHIDPKNKLNNISILVNSCYSIETIQKEIEKCDLLCANCHRMREYKRAIALGKIGNKNIDREANRQYVNKVKDSPCCDCGERFIPFVMDLDHIEDFNKINTISGMVSQGWPLDKIKKEIEKCEIVCANCHRIRTHNRKQY